MEAISSEQASNRRLNWAGVLIAGLVSGIVLFLGDAVLNGLVLNAAWEAATSALGVSAQRTLSGLAIFIAMDLFKGIALIWLYAVIRKGIRPIRGPALIAAAMGFWVINSVLPWMMFMPMNFFSLFLVIMAPLLGLIPILIAAFVGSLIYKG